MNPDSAAHWMAQKVIEQGRLGQAEAARHLLQYQDGRLAYHNDIDQPCVGRWVLRRFQRDFPDFKYDRRLKCWRRS